MEFACKNFNIEEVIRCGLKLTKADYKILKLLMENQNKKIDTNTISSKLNIDLSTSQRSLKKMNERKLVKRSQINFDKGSYSLIYCICDKEEIRYTIKKIIYNWIDKFNSEIEKW